MPKASRKAAPASIGSPAASGYHNPKCLMKHQNSLLTRTFDAIVIGAGQAGHCGSHENNLTIRIAPAIAITSSWSS
jgi:6-phosphogluconolactonase/glucosamine-6-phosphate isomerase/deaminase